jgi:hypothetical protein
MSLPAVDVNWVHVVVGALVPMVLGALWYSPVLFAKQWMKLTGKTTMGDAGNPGPAYALTFIGSIVQSYVLTHFLVYTGANTASTGATTGLWLAIGFIIPAFAADFIFSGKPRQLYWITVGYYSLSLVLMGAVLAAWQ